MDGACSCCRRALAELAARPNAATALASLCNKVGRGLGGFLLQQFDWVLQVGSRPQKLTADGCESRAATFL